MLCLEERLDYIVDVCATCMKYGGSSTAFRECFDVSKPGLCPDQSVRALYYERMLQEAESLRCRRQSCTPFMCMCLIIEVPVVRHNLILC